MELNATGPLVPPHQKKFDDPAAPFAEIWKLRFGAIPDGIGIVYVDH